MEIAAEDTDVYPVPGGRVDVDAMLREQLDLQLPVKPLCSATCRGLCPSCGADRNRTECECVQDDVDPRMAPLLHWKKDEDVKVR